jgi:glycine cleavage system pyridoxal-binding protein P
MHAPYRPEVDAGETSFAERHVGPNPRDIDAMLATVGAKSLDALIAEVIPASIRRRGPLALAPALSERAALDRMREIAGKNEVFTSLIGQGYYGTILPPVIQRNILENPGWYTAYTPYQPEISQGRLEALMNFQTMVADLTGLPVANASLLDEATAAAEAMTLAHRAAAAKVSSFFVDRNVHPQTLAVLQVRAEPLGIDLVVGSPGDDLARTDVFGALLQYPDTFGTVSDYRDAIAAVHARGGLAILAADPLALTLLMPPGELGADIAIGSTQRFGVPMGFGGPHAAYMAVRDDLKRNMPGRVVGLSIDARGAPAYRLALQTREQHIRRFITAPMASPASRAAFTGGRRSSPTGCAGSALRRRTRPSSTRSRSRSASGRARSSRAPARSESICAPSRQENAGRRRRSASASMRPPTTQWWKRSGAHSAGRSPMARSRLGRSRRFRQISCAGRPSCAIRYSAATTARPRCCATCAGSPIATLRSTAP